MDKHYRLFDTEGYMLLQRYKQGVRLVLPGVQDVFPRNNSIATLYDLPMTVYFLDGESRIVNTNQAAIELIGANSLSDMQGKTVKSFVNSPTVDKVLATDRVILRTQVMQVTQESVAGLHNVPLESLSFKFPWYDDNKLIGLFGCSIKTDSLALSGFAPLMTQLMATGLLGSAPSSLVDLSNKLENLGVELTEREQEVLSYVIRGKTAKEIARQLAISRRTVEHHIAAIKQKTNSTFKSDLIDKFV